jgi:GTP cyclohydrolase II
MFKLLGVDEVRLLTNNPRKVEILTEADQYRRTRPPDCGA